MKPPLWPALLTAALLASPAARAVERSNDGLGDVLLFPYLVANERFATVLTMSNRAGHANATTADAIAVRVALRFADEDASVAPPPRLFNVLLAAHDTWTFAAVQGAGGAAAIHSVDLSCAFASDGVLDAFGGSGIPAAEGWIEVFELGRITSAAVLERMQGSDRRQACSDLAALLPTLETSDWLAPPQNALRGTSHLVAVASGTAFTVEPVVLRDFRDAPLFAAATEDAPTLADARPAQAVVTLADGTRRPSTFSARPVDAVSAVLMSSAWEVDFDIASELDARTDLVATFPTRRWHAQDGLRLPPFADPRRSDGATEIGVRVFDREGRPPADAVAKCTPPAPAPTALGPLIDRDVVVLEFGQAAVFESGRAQPLTYTAAADCVQGGLVPRRLSDHFSTGRVVLEFVDDPSASTGQAGARRLVSDEGHVFRGLPAIGTAMTAVVNANAMPGVLASYGIDQPIARRTDYPGVE